MSSPAVDCLRHDNKNTNDDNYTNNENDSLISRAAAELSSLPHTTRVPFPSLCQSVVQQHIPGNSRCMDCGAQHPQWAAPRYGILLCLQCSGVHRSLGVQVSSVRSLAMDEWTRVEILQMLEGGNAQLAQFFRRHQLTRETVQADSKTYGNVTKLRYKTKAAAFYRNQMELHVQKLLQDGPYRGRRLRGNKAACR